MLGDDTLSYLCISAVSAQPQDALDTFKLCKQPAWILMPRTVLQQRQKNFDHERFSAVVLTSISKVDVLCIT